MEERLSQTLARHPLIGLDACVLIYYLEGHEEFGPAADAVVSHLFQGKNTAILSTMALCEVLVGPYRTGDYNVADAYCGFLHSLPNCHWVPATYEIADLAAELRGQFRMETPDAVHLATAIKSDATLFVTNDRELPAIDGVEYLLLGS